MTEDPILFLSSRAVWLAEIGGAGARRGRDGIKRHGKRKKEEESAAIFFLSSIGE